MAFEELIKRPLEIQYVQGILDKLTRTLEKYELVIPEIDEMIQETVSTKPEDHFGIVITIVEKLMKYKSASPFMNELAENVKRDFWHGVNADLPKHDGEFYIDSVAD
jgi:hypothetical protein